jgi:peptide/nickel transport system permease protein
VTRYLIRRLGFLLLTLLLTSVVIFILTQFLPGDVARIVLGREAGEAALEPLRAELGLDRALPAQYLMWLADFVRGDWGRSISTGQAIRPLVLERLGNSLMLAALTLVIAVPVAVFLGVVAALNENRPLDELITVGFLSVVGLPEFVTGLVLIQLLAFQLNLFLASSSIRPEAGFSSRPCRCWCCLL